MDKQNGGGATEGGKLELKDRVVIETTDGKSHSYLIVALADDDEDGDGYAIAYDEDSDEFIVTSTTGVLLEDDDVAQEILDSYLVLLEESAGDES